ncbi:16S rRNA (cytosine(967)-C(5))-methyltransferase RsmB [Caldibacillus thermoamylovorans]|uniref:16S rRNA (cytosine(967)-C(5))-methyltransferase RsmB n=1 Tax=Caldibacillus thermoamylovorans TaxID=35841 RepID=UPI0022E11683|nr:16S rRNA (cytosine(967)-C(5))-methyltransferase RsmB [Caldibacillus thermoamylovorans]MDL0418517.1 16S rRNA (cytosine(967)-C(5))-methyltransferase RsmB [Caldibacillus thermoamylovorans]
MSKKVREAALDILEFVEKNGAYSNLVLNNTINKNKYSSMDAALLTELCYGTLQRQITLDFFLNPFIKKQKRIDSWVRQLLRLSVYQMVYLDKIPDHAIINEAVQIAKKRGNKGISGFVNGVLRSIQREGVPPLAAIQDSIERLSIETSHPKWLVERWVQQYGFEKTKQMCEENVRPAKQTARINEWKTNMDYVIESLGKEGISVEKSSSIPVAVKADKGNFVHSLAFQNGLLTMQDESSMIVAYVVAPEKGEKILDACAAPGGKTTHMAERMENTGEIIALDLHEHKVKLINQNAARLGLTNIRAKQTDSRQMGTHFEKESFDRILVDAPCSGFGVLKRKPDVKYTKTEKDIKNLTKLQLELLNQAAPLVKPGGILVYSTCTVDQDENQRVTEKFLAEHPDFAGDETIYERVPQAIRPFVHHHEIEILPQYLKSDGFYIACFQKKV